MASGHDENVESAIALIEGAGLRYPENALLECFVIDALSPRAAATYVLEACPPGQAQREQVAALVADWRFITTSSTYLSIFSSSPDNPADCLASVARWYPSTHPRPSNPGCHLGARWRQMLHYWESGKHERYPDSETNTANTCWLVRGRSKYALKRVYANKYRLTNSSRVGSDAYMTCWASFSPPHIATGGWTMPSTLCA